MVRSIGSSSSATKGSNDGNHDTDDDTSRCTGDDTNDGVGEEDGVTGLDHSVTSSASLVASPETTLNVSGVMGGGVGTIQGGVHTSQGG